MKFKGKGRKFMLWVWGIILCFFVYGIVNNTEKETV